MLANFHTHTTFCDGKNTPEEMVLAALEQGFTALGFSGHGPTPFDLRYCMQDIPGYIAEIRRLQKKYADKLPIFLGIEEDCFAPVNRADFDYIIGSSHYIHVDAVYYSVDSGEDYLKKAADACGGPREMAETYYRNFCAYILDRKPDIAGHFDLITKYEQSGGSLFFGSEAYWQTAEKYLRKAVESGCLFEVNTGAMARGLRTTPYPHERLLHILKKEGANVILSSDSHSAQTLDFGFGEVKALLKDVGFAHTFTLTRDGFVSAAL